MGMACWQVPWSPAEMVLGTSGLLLRTQSRPVGCVYGGQEQRWAWVQGPLSFCCAVWSAAEPSVSYSELVLGRLAAFHVVSLWNAPAAEKKKNPPKLIIGQARKEGKECCFSDGRFPVGPRGFSGDIPKFPWCCFSVLSLSEAGRYERNAWNKVLLWGKCSYLCSFLVTIWYLCCETYTVSL